jgi:hypothetical protein
MLVDFPPSLWFRVSSFELDAFPFLFWKKLQAVVSPIGVP